MSDFADIEQLGKQIDEAFVDAAVLNTLAESTRALCREFGYVSTARLIPALRMRFQIVGSPSYAQPTCESRWLTAHVLREHNISGELQVVRDPAAESFVGQQLWFGSGDHDGEPMPGWIIPAKQVMVSRDGWASHLALEAVYGDILIEDIPVFQHV